MNQDVFVDEKRQNWEKLTELLDRAQSRGGIKGFSSEEVQSLGSLYRRACSDLSYARSKKYDPDVIRYLNQLARRAYGLIYLNDKETKGEVGKFFSREFPRLFRENFSYIAAAIIVFVVFTIVGAVLDQADPRYTHMLVPEQFISIWDSPEPAAKADADVSQMPLGAAGYWTHNFKVGMSAFAAGITLGLGTFYMIAYNGVIMGSLGSLVIRSGYHLRFFSFVSGHAFVELMAIFICGGAGFMIARAILVPGDLPIRHSLNVHGRPAVLLMLGTIPMFLIAGIIEASFSRLPLPLPVKVGMGLLTCLIMFLYFSWDVDKSRLKKFKHSD